MNSESLVYGPGDILKHRDCRYFQYIGSDHIEVPPVRLTGLEVGDLFVHKLRATDAQYHTIWMINAQKVWVGCTRFDLHPNQDKYPRKVLSLRDHKPPSWVSRKTAVDYVSKDERRG